MNFLNVIDNGVDVKCYYVQMHITRCQENPVRQIQQIQETFNYEQF